MQSCNTKAKPQAPGQPPQASGAAGAVSTDCTAKRWPNAHRLTLPASSSPMDGVSTAAVEFGAMPRCPPQLMEML